MLLVLLPELPPPPPTASVASDTEAPTSERCPAGGEAKRLRHGLGHRSAPSARQPVPRRPWEHEHCEGRESPAAGSAPSSKAAPSPRGRPRPQTHSIRRPWKVQSSWSCHGPLSYLRYSISSTTWTERNPASMESQFRNLNDTL